MRDAPDPYNVCVCAGVCVYVCVCGNEDEELFFKVYEKTNFSLSMGRKKL